MPVQIQGVPRSRGLKDWLLDERVITIVIGVMLADGVTRILGAFSENVAAPMVRALINDDGDEPHLVHVGKETLNVRRVFVTVIEFVLVVAIAYALSRWFIHRRNKAEEESA